MSCPLQPPLGARSGIQGLSLWAMIGRVNIQNPTRNDQCPSQRASFCHARPRPGIQSFLIFPVPLLHSLDSSFHWNDTGGNTDFRLPLPLPLSLSTTNVVANTATTAPDTPNRGGNKNARMTRRLTPDAYCLLPIAPALPVPIENGKLKFGNYSSAGASSSGLVCETTGSASLT